MACSCRLCRSGQHLGSSSCAVPPSGGLSACPTCETWRDTWGPWPTAPWCRCSSCRGASSRSRCGSVWTESSTSVSNTNEEIQCKGMTRIRGQNLGRRRRASDSELGLRLTWADLITGASTEEGQGSNALQACTKAPPGWEALKRKIFFSPT